MNDVLEFTSEFYRAYRTESLQMCQILSMVVTRTAPGIVDHGLVMVENTVPRMMAHGSIMGANTIPRMLAGITS